MRRSILTASLIAGFLVFGLVAQAQAFVFTDLLAKAQRLAMMAQVAEQIQKIDDYRKEFDKYHVQFNKYFVNFQRIYRRLSSNDWQDFMPSEWARLKDHVIAIWKTFDQAAYDAQVVSLKINPLYERSPEFKVYADQLIALSEGLITQLKLEEAHLMELQTQDANHAHALERFKGRNGGLVIGEDTPGNEIALSQQIALMNSILIEIASIQAEQKVVQQRLLTDQKEARNLIMKMKQLEIDAQRGSIRNIDQLSELTRSR